MADHFVEEFFMEYVKVAQTTDFAEGTKRKITWEGKDILLTNIQNNYYAIDNMCPHMGGSLYDGKLENNQIICPKHGSIFDVTTGKVVKSGKLLFISVKVHDVHNYPVKIEGIDLLIGIE
jgi:3-phenylpropionate/trans-cinnamate dioxygenase ferredoxin component